jgi:hypothetical protein
MSLSKNTGEPKQVRSLLKTGLLRHYATCHDKAKLDSSPLHSPLRCQASLHSWRAHPNGLSIGMTNHILHPCALQFCSSSGTDSVSELLCIHHTSSGTSLSPPEAAICPCNVQQPGAPDIVLVSFSLDEGICGRSADSSWPEPTVPILPSLDRDSWMSEHLASRST